MRRRTSSSVVRRSSCLSLLWLFVFLVPVCSADDRISSWNECLQRDWGDGRVNINVSCNGSDIDVHFFVPVNSVLNNYYTCLLEYICILPNGSSTTPRAIPSPVVNLQPHYNVTTDTPLPGETVCTVRGCYEDIDYFLFAFNQSCTTGEKIIANKLLPSPLPLSTLDNITDFSTYTI
jgi:hypothetical protein